MKKRLQDFSVLVESSDICVVVEGVSGCGKSSLLREYTSLANGEDTIFIHLGEQIDSKVRVPSELLHMCSNLSIALFLLWYDLKVLERNLQLHVALRRLPCESLFNQLHILPVCRSLGPH